MWTLHASDMKATKSFHSVRQKFLELEHNFTQKFCESSTLQHILFWISSHATV